MKAEAKTTTTEQAHETLVQEQTDKLFDIKATLKATLALIDDAELRPAEDVKLRLSELIDNSRRLVRLADKQLEESLDAFDRA